MACASMATPVISAGGVRGITQDEDFSIIGGPIVGELVNQKSISFHPERSANFPPETVTNDFLHYLDMDGSDFPKKMFVDEEHHPYDPLEEMIDSYFPPDEDFMLPGEEMDRETTPSESEEYNENRILQEEFQYLYPLPCNEEVAFDCTTTSLSSLPVPTDGSPLVIECGTCVHVDISDGELLDFPNGLRIEGKLYIPSEASLTISTIYVMVLGILKIDYPVVGNEVKFHLYNEIVNGVAADQYFIADPNKQDPKTTRCLGDGCKIGKKAIAVVGGQLDIQEYDSACPSWENLSDISTAETEAPSVSPSVASPYPACSGNRYENGDFENFDIAPWKFWSGNINDWIGEDDLTPGNTAIKVFSRKGWYQGPYQELAPECFSDARQTWRLEIDLRLLDAETNNGIECDPTISGIHACPFFLYQAKQPNGVHQWGSYYDHGMEWNKDGWSHFSVVFDSPEHWIDATVIRGIILGGPDTATLMVDNVKLERCYGCTDGSNDNVNNNQINVNNNQIHLSQKVAECWTPGSEIMITSGTLMPNGHQIATIESTDPATGTLKLTSSIDAVSTLTSDPNHAVEVALLSRRIIFEADDDEDDDLIGGHLIVLMTPDVVQHIEGVEIRNFGQQGNLGRYPIHFHLCNNSFGSVVKKNVVRQSNQRCYVIHGTNGVLIEDNVAFDNFGHCYMTEDGVEHSNRFIGNLGSYIKDASRLLGPRKETDDDASIFWMTNMENEFEGNVASGAGKCYWVETHRSMNNRGPAKYQKPDHIPRLSNLGSFKDNSAHSCDTGFAGYSPGWQPIERAVIENFRAYRIFSTGVFLHNNENLTFKGGYFAQIGYVAIRVFAADDIIIDGTEFVGNIEGETELCRFGQHKAIILSPHRSPTMHRNAFDHFGTQLKNLKFSRWSPRDDCDAPLVDISTTQIFQPGWDAYNLMENIVHDDSNPIIGNACRYEGEFASDTAIEISGDADTAYGGSGFLVGELNTHLSHTDGGCTDVGGCLYFCPDACLRTVKFYTSGARDIFGTVMKVSDGTNTVTVDRWYKNFDVPNTEKRYYEYSNFGISLPAGSFTVWFEKEGEPGVKVYPKFVHPKFEMEPKCSGFITQDDIAILKPPKNEPRCHDLINNGEFALDTAGWQDWAADPYFSENAGVDGTGALFTKANHAHTTLTQWLDTSCIEDGDYLIHASYRIVDQTDDLTNAQDEPILPNVHYGPHTSLQFRRWDQDLQDKENIATSWMQDDFAPPTDSPTQSPTITETFPELAYVGNNGGPPQSFPLGNCQGDCDRDSECQDGLVCFQRSGFTPVPGCSSKGAVHADYCYDPNAAPAQTSPPISPPVAANALETVMGENGDVVGTQSLGVCQGDCDSDSDCEIGLVCFQQNGESVPGCAGNPASTTKYCVNPNLPELTGFQYISGLLTITPDQASRASAVRIQFHGMRGLMILDNVSLVKAPWSVSETDTIV